MSISSEHTPYFVMDARGSPLLDFLTKEEAYRWAEQYKTQGIEAHVWKLQEVAVYRPVHFSKGD